MKARDGYQAILNDLMQLFQTVTVYPETHQFVQEPLVRLHGRIREAAKPSRKLTFGFLVDQVVIEDVPFLATTAGSRRLIRKMNERGIEKLVFDERIEAEELKRFVTLVACAPPDALGGGWRFLAFGRLTGGEEIVAAELGPKDPSSQTLNGAAGILKGVLQSLATGEGQGGVGEGRDIVAAVMNALRNEEFLIDRLIRLQSHDDYTVTHSLNVCVMVVAQAARLGFPDGMIHEVGLAALLHDIGKELVPREILNKPGKLDSDEFARMSLHPSLGALHLKKLSLATDLPLIVCYEHHIRYDRSGYPKVRYAEELHPISLMTQIADVYDALRTYRPYRASLDQETTLGILRKGRGSEFDPFHLDNFLQMVS
jgi:HD-GYP domain-containing protein (c-di-GMP phosphodiesterase class II)